MSEIIRWNARETVAALKAREVSAEEVTRAHLERIAEVNPTLNAITEENPEALTRARAIDNGKVDGGFLHGAPITTKINADQTGFATSNGLPAYSDVIAPADSAVVANMQAAGGIVVGRTNAPEMSLRWCSSNPLHGITLNPWDSSVTPGGSSGGASSSLAAGVGVLAHGNDLGGSVRYPAYCCGLAGLKPSFGRIPSYNPTAPTLRPPMITAMATQGPLARTAGDLRLGLDAMRARHASDGNWSPALTSGRQRGSALKIGLAPSPFGMETHPHLIKAMEIAANGLEAVGLKVERIDLPETALICALWGKLLSTETEFLSRKQVESDGTPELQNWLDDLRDHFGGIYDLEGYMQGQMERMRLQRVYSELFDKIDLFVMPSSLIPPFENDLEFKDRSRAGQIIDAQAPLYLVNLLGLPAAQLPTHVQEGLPLGVQLVGPQ